jgi:hypothetical protein
MGAQPEIRQNVFNFLPLASEERQNSPQEAGANAWDAAPHEAAKPDTVPLSISKNSWHCFSECESGGNSLDFVPHNENVSIWHPP